MDRMKPTSLLTITGTWVLTEEDVLEPPRVLRQAMAWKDLPETGVFDVCDIGESREY
jgi:N-acyl-phosphatidylethanolamine-hydrolysing phospholipase D